jgi:hypothetical protein
MDAETQPPRRSGKSLGTRWAEMQHLTTTKATYKPTQHTQIDHLRNRQNFDLNKSRQKFHHSLKEHHKINNIPKFRCEML